MVDAAAIRPAREEELSTCASFWMAMFEEVGILREAELDERWRERFVAYFSRRIAQAQARYLVAADGDRIVGTAGAMLLDGYPSTVHGLQLGYVFGVRVEPACRGRGIATALTLAAVAFLDAVPCRRIRLHASPFGRRMYERLGFKPTNEMELAR